MISHRQVRWTKEVSQLRYDFRNLEKRRAKAVVLGFFFGYGQSDQSIGQRFSMRRGINKG